LEGGTPPFPLFLMRTFKKELFFYLISNFLSKFIIGISGILLARFLTKEEFGLFKTISVFVSFIGIFINFGLNDYLLFEISRKRSLKLPKKIIGSYLIMYILFFPLSIIFYFFLYSKALFLMIIFYFKLIVDWLIDLITKIFQSKNRFGIISILILLNSIFMFLPVLYIYIANGNLKSYVISLLMVSFLSLIIYIITYGYLENIWNLIPAFNIDKNVLKGSHPFFMSGLMAFIYMQSDILMLSFMTRLVEVSRYSVVTTLIFAAYLLPVVLYNYFLPKLAGSFKEKKEFIQTYNQFKKIIILLCLPVAIILFTFSYEILHLIFTSKYVDSNYILKTLAVVFFFHSICFVFGAVITASGNQKLRSKIQIFAAVTNILLNIIFIPLYGAEGAAFTTALTEVIIFLLYWYFSKEYIHGEKSL